MGTAAFGKQGLRGVSLLKAARIEIMIMTMMNPICREYRFFYASI